MESFDCPAATELDIGCDNCGKVGALEPVYEEDDPDTGYRGDRTPVYLCYACRNPHAAQICAAEAAAAERAMRILGVVKTC